MATWEDGPEYAPLERPEEFTSPAVDPLEAAPPAPVPAAVPVQRPLFTDPSVPVAPLAALVPPPADDRDPQQPFAVTASTLTSGSAWGSAHQAVAATPAAPPLPPFPPAAALGPAPVTPQWPTSAPVPGPAPWPAPPLPAPSPSYPPPFPPSSPFPAPGTPQWFGPGPYPQQPPPRPVDARRVLEAATPGLLIVLAIGAVVFVLSPVMLAIAYTLSSRVTAARAAVHRALGVGLLAVGFFALVGLTRAPVGFGDWWSFVGIWALLACWTELVVVSALVYQRLRRDAAPPPVQPRDWR